MRKGWASRTAIWVSAWRGLGKFFPEPIAHDPIAKDLVGGAFRLILEAAEQRPATARALVAIATVATGGLARHLPLRTRAIDEVLVREVSRGTRQVILLGAGLDARAHRLEALSGCTVFEVDHPDTQVHKRESVRGLPRTAKDIRYVPVDFERDDLRRALKEAGLDPARPSAIVWEGVTMYLERDAIERTLDAIATLAPKGSALIITYHDVKVNALARLARPVFRIVGEPLRTQLSPPEMNTLLASRGFERISDEGDEEWSARLVGKKNVLSMSERLIHARRQTLLA
jgi:methyltransferase (TIGR00027 family)